MLSTVHAIVCVNQPMQFGSALHVQLAEHIENECKWMTTENNTQFHIYNYKHMNFLFLFAQNR